MWQLESHLPILICQLFLLQSVLAIHAVHWPILSIGSHLPILQCLTPPKCSHEQYFKCNFCLVTGCLPGVKGLHADPQCLNSAHQTVRVTTIS